MENSLSKSLATLLDRDEKEIDDMITTMDFKDLTKVSRALKDADKETALKILHGYGL